MPRVFTTLILILSLTVVQVQNQSKMRIEQRFNKVLKSKDVHNGFLQISSDAKDIDWKFIGGTFKDNTLVTEQNPFYVASIGKMFTATAIMQLVEQGKIQLNDPLSKHLDSNTITKLHVFNGKDYSSEITIKQLLQHTSGLPDYIEDKPKDGGSNLLTKLVNETDKYWEVTELLTYSKAKLAPHFEPGKNYNYTDTEYLILGLILEDKHQKKLHKLFEDVFFKPLGMYHSYMYLRASPIAPTKKLAELYINQHEVSSFQSLTIDWAGGGIASTTEDLIAFQRALWSGKIISQNSLSLMQEWYPESKGTYYGLGLRKYELREFSKLLPNLTLIGHSGLSASFLFYCPELDIHFAGTFNQMNEMKQAIKFLFKTLLTLQLDKQYNATN